MLPVARPGTRDRSHRPPAPVRRTDSLRAVPDVEPEELEDALLEGDRPVRRGTARAALRSATFRRVYVGSLLSNIGTWMQNLILGAFAYDLTGSPAFVSYVTFAQLGPLLLLSLVGGTLADLVDRRRLLIAVATQQLVLSLALARVVAGDDPAPAAFLGIVFLIGVGQAVHAPTFTSVIPTLVPREDLLGAVSLQSASMNASRVVGPAIGGLLYARLGAPWVFVGNAATYLFIIGALASVDIPPVPARSADEAQGLRRLLGGFEAASRDRVIGRCLVTMALFSFFALPFVTQMPTLAEQRLGIDPKSVTFGLLYATFGLGALFGALSIGTVLAGRALATLVRIGLCGFAVSLSALALLEQAGAAFPVALIVGFTYFATVTSLSSVVQTRVDDADRGRVMALWIMAFGGTVPIGAVVAGPIIEATSISAVMLVGAVVAVGLAWFADLRDPTERGPRADAPTGSAG